MPFMTPFLEFAEKPKPACVTGLFFSPPRASASSHLADFASCWSKLSRGARCMLRPDKDK